MFTCNVAGLCAHLYHSALVVYRYIYVSVTERSITAVIRRRGIIARTASRTAAVIMVTVTARTVTAAEVAFHTANIFTDKRSDTSYNDHWHSSGKSHPDAAVCLCRIKTDFRYVRVDLSGDSCKCHHKHEPYDNIGGVHIEHSVHYEL